MRLLFLYNSANAIYVSSIAYTYMPEIGHMMYDQYKLTTIHILDI